MPPASSSRDLREVLRHALLEDSAVTEIVEGRVFGSHGRDADEATRVQPVLIMEFMGGSAWALAPLQQRSVKIYGYSNNSSGEAERVYQAAAAVIERKTIRGRLDENGDPCKAVCGYGWESDGPYDGWNHEQGAWFVWGKFTLWGIG